MTPGWLGRIDPNNNNTLLLYLKETLQREIFSSIPSLPAFWFLQLLFHISLYCLLEEVLDISN